MILLTGRITRELGGGWRAGLLATSGALIAPVYLGICGFYSMNAFDLVFWAGSFLILLRIVNTVGRVVTTASYFHILEVCESSS